MSCKCHDIVIILCSDVATLLTGVFSLIALA